MADEKTIKYICDNITPDKIDLAWCTCLLEYVLDDIHDKKDLTDSERLDIKNIRYLVKGL